MIATRTLILLLGASFSLYAGCGTTSTARSGAAAEAAHADFEVLEWAQVDAAMKAGALLVDARSAKSFAKGHISGAVNGPWRDEQAVKAILPKSMDQQLIFYCGGPQCPASTRSAQIAQALGHTRIGEYKAGYPQWRTEILAKQPCSALDPAACATATHCKVVATDAGTTCGPQSP